MRFLTFIARNLVRRRTRTVLTVLGIAVSVGAMVALLSVSRRFSEAMEESFRARGVDLVVLSRGVIDQLSSDIDEQMVEQIAALPGVKSVTPGLITLEEVQRGEGSTSVLVQGWPEENFVHHDLKLVAGNWLDYSGRGKVLLGPKAAENLRKNVGDTIYLSQQPYEVAGIYDSLIHFEKGGVVMPIKELQALAGRPGSVTGVSVVCEGSTDKAAVVQRLKEQIESLPPTGRGRRGLSADFVNDYLKNAIHLRITSAMAWLIAAIALVIGTIGMINTMVMSVLERVHEIGILRAVGWPRSRVIRMVLGEAVMLGVLGAAVGILGAFLLVQALTQVPAVSGFIDGQMSSAAIFQGLAMTVLMGLVGGAYPAYRASLLHPTEALRHE